ncbi:hypothetical protein HK101_007947 [Irineochytrium annulatum]|nr:hypothetical protein HK101_007947 [Irineochytrium annulatum]
MTGLPMEIWVGLDPMSLGREGEFQCDQGLCLIRDLVYAEGRFWFLTDTGLGMNRGSSVVRVQASLDAPSLSSSWMSVAVGRRDGWGLPQGLRRVNGTVSVFDVEDDASTVRGLQIAAGMIWTREKLVEDELIQGKDWIQALAMRQSDRASSIQTLANIFGDADWGEVVDLSACEEEGCVFTQALVGIHYAFTGRYRDQRVSSLSMVKSLLSTVALPDVQPLVTGGDQVTRACYVEAEGDEWAKFNEEVVAAMRATFTVRHTRVITAEERRGLGRRQKALVLQRCNVLVGLVFTDLEYVFYLERGSTIIELTRQNPRDRVIEHLAAYIGVRYLYSYIEPHGIPRLSGKSVPRLLELAKSAADGRRAKYFMYMPWEQINNQLIGLRCACAVASILNRTLVLPPVGHRTQQQDDSWDFSFAIDDFTWRPVETYFDSVSLHSLPCSHITSENLRAFTAPDRTFTLDQVSLNPVAKATSARQLTDYYESLLGFNVTSIDTQSPKLSQLTNREVLRLWGDDDRDAIAIGAAFWLYGFGRTQPYPLTSYVSYMDDDVYRATVKALTLAPRLERRLGTALRRLSPTGAPVLAVHVRRGDYWNKCKHIKDEELRAHCYPSDEAVIAAIDDAWSGNSVLRIKEGMPMTVYVSTNLGGFRKEMQGVKGKYKVVYFEDLFGEIGAVGGGVGALGLGAEQALDASDAALLDVELCSRVAMLWSTLEY